MIDTSLSRSSVRQFRCQAHHRYRMFQLLRAISLFLVTSLLAGCPTIGLHQISPPPVTGASPSDKKVLVIVVEGLHQGVLKTYLKRILHEEYEPDWSSGLALLAQDGFRLALLQRARGPLPSQGLTAAATIATGEFPSRHGIIGSHFYNSRVDGQLWHYNFQHPIDAASLWFAPGLTPASFDAPPPGQSALRVAPWSSESGDDQDLLSPTVVFHPFGLGAQWWVPAEASPATEALIPTARGAAATMLLDRWAMSAAAGRLVGDQDIAVVHLRGLRALNCFQTPRACRDPDSTLEQRQEEALKWLDGQLEPLISQLRKGRPQAYSELTVLLTGTHGSLSRYPEPPEQFRKSWTELETEFLSNASSECKSWWQQASSHGRIAFAPQSGTGHLYIRRSPPGQTSFRRQGQVCLTETLPKMVDGVAWLAGAAWFNPVGPKHLQPRHSRLVLHLDEKARSTFGEHRRARFFAKLGQAVDQGDSQRFGDAVFFVHEAYEVIDSDSSATVHEVREGGIHQREFEIPLFVASRLFTDETASELSGATVELNDVWPTVLNLVGRSNARSLRPPLLHWTHDTQPRLKFNRADRHIQTPSVSVAKPKFYWWETTDAIHVSLIEPNSIWPANVVKLNLGQASYTWRGESEAFTDPATPCKYETDKTTRIWHCAVPVDRSRSHAVKATLKRSPGVENETMEQTIVFNIGQSSPDINRPPRLRCRDKENVEVQVPFGSTAPLARAELSVQSISSKSRHDARALLSAETALDDSRQPQASSNILTLKFPSWFFEHHTRASRLLLDGAAQATPYGAEMHSMLMTQKRTTDNQLWATLALCDVTGQCARQLAFTDAEYRSATLCADDADDAQ